LGIENLFQAGIASDRYQLNFDHAKPLARELEILHKNEFAHRDVKPGNLIFNSKTGEICLIDLDLGCPVSGFKGFSGNLVCIPREFLLLAVEEDLDVKSVDIKTPYNAFKQDQFAFIAVLCMLLDYRAVEAMRCSIERVPYVNQLVERLPCSPEHKENLTNFMLKPTNIISSIRWIAI
jgi:serine/threonine protein kinase